MKRFYKMVTTSQKQGGFSIHLDGKPVRTPAGASLATPYEELANGISLEWAAQETDIDPETMPLTQMLTTKIDRVSEMREAMQIEILKYLDTDLLCYRADTPPALLEVQEVLWNPPLDWFANYFQVKLEVTTGLAALSHPIEAHQKVAEDVSAMDDDRFTLVQLITSMSGSLILALAFIHGQVSAQNISNAAYAEEDFKAKLYGEDEHGQAPGQEEKRAKFLSDVIAIETYLKALN